MKKSNDHSWKDICKELITESSRMFGFKRGKPDVLKITSLISLAQYKQVRRCLSTVFSLKKPFTYRHHFSETEIGDVLSVVGYFVCNHSDKKGIPTDQEVDTARLDFLIELDKMTER